MLTSSVIAHRGLWTTAQLKPNSSEALAAAVDAGFGVETDVRDQLGSLVISHDPPDGAHQGIETLLDIYRRSTAPLAVNIKSDGLGDALGAAFAGATFPWFAFDMSVPEMVRYAAAGIPFYTRHSDVESDPLLYGAAGGVWLDAFHGQWFDLDVVRAHLERGKNVVIVSPELHGRDARALADLVNSSDLSDHGSLYVCTDRPDIWVKEAGVQ